MKCQILFSGKNKKKHHQFSSAELAQGVIEFRKVTMYLGLDPQFENIYIRASAQQRPISLAPVRSSQCAP